MGNENLYNELFSKYLEEIKELTYNIYTGDPDDLDFNLTYWTKT